LEFVVNGTMEIDTDELPAKDTRNFVPTGEHWRMVSEKVVDGCESGKNFVERGLIYAIGIDRRADGRWGGGRGDGGFKCSGRNWLGEGDSGVRGNQDGRTRGRVCGRVGVCQSVLRSILHDVIGLVRVCPIRSERRD
jgi:hypothetical protein